MFDKGLQQPQQLNRPSASDLSQALVELSRKYGLHIELETEGEPVAGSPTPDAKADETTTKCAKSNILSAVRGKAQRLWHQGQVVFKGGDSGGRVDVDKEIVHDDVEGGRIKAVHTGTAPPVQKSPCSVITVNETVVAERPARNFGGSLRYHTLEYGASPADVEAHSSPDSGVQCCTVNPSEPISDKDDAAVTVTITDNKVAMAEKDVAAKVELDEPIKLDRDAVLKTVDDGRKPVLVKSKNDETKHSNPPPPPPPRKYSAPVVPVTVQPVTVATATTTPEAMMPIIATGAPEPCATQLPVACAETIVKPSDAAINEIRVDDDYYWCTTTAMAPPMSTFGKRPSVTPSDDVGAAVTAIVSAAETTIVGAAETAIVDAVETAIVGGAPETTIGVGAAAVSAAVDDVDSSREVAAGGTASIEDASLPSFSSDEDEDDEDNCNGSAFATDNKSKFPPCSSTADTSNAGGVAGVNSSSKCVANTLAGESSNNVDNDVSAVAPAATAEPKSPTKLPTLRLSLSSPLSSSTPTSCSSSSSASSSTSTSPSPTNSTIISSPIVSKIPVRRQSAGGGIIAASTPLTNGTAKKAIPLPLSRSGSRLAMWSSVN